MCLMHLVAGASRRRPEEMDRGLSDAARRLVDAAYARIDRARLFDHHVHIVGTGANGSGAYVNPQMLTWRHPLHRLKFETESGHLLAM